MLFKQIIFLSVLLNFLYASTLEIQAQCEKQQQYIFKIENNELYLSTDAVVDNTGGYVDIPHQNYYLKLDNEVISFHGDVIKINASHSFSISVDDTIVEKILISKTHFFIQKIELAKKNQDIHTHNIVTTVKLALEVNKALIEKTYKSCKKK